MRRPATPIARPRPRGRPDPLLAAVVAGLAAPPRAIPSSYFYDDRGSRLFQWIANLPGYYLTRVERALLAARAGDVAAALRGGPCTVVDLGAGDGHKSRPLLAALAADGAGVTYAPVDLSGAALAAAARAAAGLAGVGVHPVHAGWSGALRRLPPRAAGERRLVLFLGSSIGNLEHRDALALLRALRAGLTPGDHLLVGFDLVKPLPLLLAAYDDPQGVTRELNLNLLARANRELGADFDLAAFRHEATWDPSRPAMESWLVSRRDQAVRLAGRTLRLAAGERIHTEISCKYTGAQLDALAAGAGLAEAARFEDGRGGFADALWRVP